jgi:hypothetical protein
MLWMVPSANLQDDGVNFDRVNMFGAVAECPGNIVARPGRINATAPRTGSEQEEPLQRPGILL